MPPATASDFLDAAQNARLVAVAERYYRVMYYGARRELEPARPAHVRDARRVCCDATARTRRRWSGRTTPISATRASPRWAACAASSIIGQLCREHFGEEAALIGFGTHGGTVAAATDWDGPMEVKRINPSRPDSYERLCHDSGVPQFLLDLRKEHERVARGAERTAARTIHRRDLPAGDRAQSHYSGVELPRQFDAWVWFDRTSAVTPLPTEQRTDVPATWPFGL